MVIINKVNTKVRIVIDNENTTVHSNVLKCMENHYDQQSQHDGTLKCMEYHYHQQRIFKCMENHCHQQLVWKIVINNVNTIVFPKVWNIIINYNIK